MRVLFTSLPALGHLNSLLPVALAVQRAGHSVAICTSPAYSAEVGERGMEHLPGGADALEDFFPPDMPRYGPARALWVAREVFAKAAPNRLMPDLEGHVDSWQLDIVVRESAEFAGCVLAERLGLAHAAVATGSRSARADDRLRFAPSLPELRARHGLDADPELAMPTRYLTLSLVPPTWDGDAELPETLRHFRYEAPASLDGAAVSLPENGRPLVLAALGTLFHRAPGLFEAIIEALGALEVEVVAAVGRDQDAGRFASVPPNVSVVPWVPQAEMLGHAALFVTHGGFNSTKEALSRGVPLVVLPLGADQFYTAERVEALGLGIQVGSDERDPATLRAGARRVLEDPAYRERSAAFAAEMAALPPLSDAVELIERLARERRPIRRSGLD